MKSTGRLIVLGALLFALALSGAHAQSAIETLAGDLSDFIEQSGRELTPQMQTSSITSLEAGTAELGGFPNMYVSLGVGALLTDGIGDVIDADYTIDLEGILQEELRDEQLYDLLRGFLPLPVLRLTYGIGLPRGFEANLQLMTVPSALTEDRGVEGASFGLTNIGGRVRKTLLPDGPKIPAIAIGVGYVYSSFNLAYRLEELETVDVGNTTINVTGGDLDYEVVTHSAGLDVRVSKKVGPITPYMGVAGWYQWSSFGGGVENLTGTIGGSPVGPVEQPRDFEDNDLNSIVSAGADLTFGIFLFFLEGGYAFSTRTPSAYTGFRVQF